MLPFILFIFGLAMAIAPWFVRRIEPEQQIVISVLGAVVLMLSCAATVAVKFYHKVPANRALVRTGGQGVRVVLGGGIMVLPNVHHVILVSLETLRLDVSIFVHVALCG